jgi:hypothetical protein
MALDFGLGKQIVIYASELASAVDQHPYKVREETAFGVWKRFDRPSFAFSLSLAYAGEVFELCKKYIKDKPMRNALPDEIESDLGKHKFTNSLKEIFSNLEWRNLRQKIMNFVDTKEFGEAKEKVLLNLLGESERVNQAVATLCSEEKKSVEEKVEEVCKIHSWINDYGSSGKLKSYIQGQNLRIPLQFMYSFQCLRYSIYIV